MRYFIFLFFITSSIAQAEDCKNSLQTFKNKKLEAEQRSQAGICLVQKQLERSDVSLVVLRAIKDPTEDLLLREDLIEAFSKANLRKKIKVDGQLGPKDMGEQEKAAAGAVGNANQLLEIASAVKSMDEIVPTTRYEAEFFKALSEIALEESNHVLLRAAAVDAMARASRVVVDSGLYDEKLVRLTKETVRTVAMRDDVNSYYSGANLAYQAVQSITPNSDGRKISSQAAPIPVR